MNDHDRLRFEHMRQYALIAMQISQNVTRETLESDILIRLALIRAIEVIGEAASRVSTETQKSYPAIPWAPIISMRNRLIHGYFEINLDILWGTIRYEIPLLLEQLAEIIPPDTT